MRNKLISLPASKSILNRVLLINSFNLQKAIKIFCNGFSEDIVEMMNFTEALGYKVMIIEGGIKVIPPERHPDRIRLHIDRSATALRFILCRLAMMDNVESYLTVGRQLWARPHQPLVDLLQSMGAKISIQESGYHIVGKRPLGGNISIDGSISSQFISALLLNAPQFKEDTFINTKKVVSSRYIDLTLQIMKNWGIEVADKPNQYHISAGQDYCMQNDYRVENDISSACYWWALGLIRDQTICVEGVNIDSKQPDINFLDILARMGAEIQVKKDGICVGKRDMLKAIDIDMATTPDQVPTLAVLALFAQGTTKISGIQHLRYKESDRISSLCTELKKLRADITYTNGALFINPLTKKPAKQILDSHGDHRIAMALSLLTMVFPHIKVGNGDVVKKSHPDFFQNLENLR